LDPSEAQPTSASIVQAPLDDGLGAHRTEIAQCPCDVGGGDSVDPHHVSWVERPDLMDDGVGRAEPGRARHLDDRCVAEPVELMEERCAAM